MAPAKSVYTIGICPVDPYFSMYCFCLLARALANGDFSAAILPHVDPPREIASSDAAGVAGATGTEAATAAGVGAAATGAGAAAATTGSAFTSSTAAGGGTDASVAALSGALPASKFLNAATSPSSSTVTMIGTPTATSPDPAGTKCFANTPSSCASKSMLALSVSMTAMESPAAKDSPSLTFHLEMVPASIVGERAGMPTTMW
mmetsp:Transcript_5274/g.8790  ORF Transcript_5274/g.8790 Transcript_5274/m.8790 type:complete len:204 (-) Transcript_5274:230-841(-)